MARSSLTFLAAFFLVMLPLVTILVFVATHADLESTNDSSLKSLLRRPRRRAQSRWAPAVPQPNATAPTDHTAAAPAAPRPLAEFLALGADAPQGGTTPRWVPPAPEEGA